MSKWILVAPIFDEVSRDTYEESRDALQYIKDKVEILEDLSGRRIKRKEVEHILTKYPDVNFAFWNHGSDDKLFGSESEAVIELENIGILSGREVFTSACSFGKKGGVEAWKRNAKAVLAYTDVVCYTRDALKEFTEAFNFWLKRRVDDFSYKECLEKTKQRMTELIDELIEAGKILASGCMRHDRDILVCYTEDMPPEEPTCPISRLLVRFFGYETLRKLRRFRKRLIASVS